MNGIALSDGDGQRHLVQYRIAFIGSGDVRAKSTLSDINARTARMQRRHYAGQASRFPISFYMQKCLYLESERCRSARLSLRLPWFLGCLTLSTYACAAKRPEDGESMFLLFRL